MHLIVFFTLFVSFARGHWKHSAVSTESTVTHGIFDGFGLSDVEEMTLRARTEIMQTSQSNSFTAVEKVTGLATDALLGNRLRLRNEQGDVVTKVTESKVFVDSSVCNTYGDAYVEQHLLTAAGKRLIREMVALETIGLFVADISGADLNSSFQLLRRMASDLQLILPPTPSMLLMADFKFDTNTDKPKFYASTSLKVYSAKCQQDLTSVRYSSKRDPVSESPKGFEPVVSSEDFANNEQRDVAFEYETLWLDNKAGFGAEFELSNGFRLRDHGTTDSLGYSPHSERNANMSKVAFQQWYRRLWRLNEQQFDVPNERQIRHSAAQAYFLNSFVLSASSISNNTLEPLRSKTLFKFIRLTEITNSSFQPSSDVQGLVLSMARSAHRILYDPVSVFANQAVFLGVVTEDTSLLSEKDSIRRYAISVSTKPWVSDVDLLQDFRNERKLNPTTNFTKVLANVVKHLAMLQSKNMPATLPNMNYRVGSVQKKHSESLSSSICNLVLGSFAGNEHILKDTNCLPQLKYESPFAIPPFSSTFKGRLNLTCVRDTSLVQIVSKTTAHASTRFITIGAIDKVSPVFEGFESLISNARDHHIFHDVNGPLHPLPSIFVSGEPVLSRWLQMLTSTQYSWMREMIAAQIRSVAGNIIRLDGKFALSDPFKISPNLQVPRASLSTAFQRNHTINSTTSVTGKAAFGFPRSMSVRWRHSNFKGLELGPTVKNEFWLQSKFTANIPLGKYVMSMSDIVKKFIHEYGAQYNITLPERVLSGADSIAVLRTAALFLFDMDTAFVDKCVARMDAEQIKSDCKISTVFKGSTLSGQRIVSSIQFHIGDESDFKKLSIFPLAISIPNEITNAPLAFKDVFEAAEAVIQTTEIIDGENRESILE